MTAIVEKSFTTTGQTDAIKARTADVSISGTFTGTFEVQRKISSTAGWEDITDEDGNAIEYTAPADVVVSSAGRCKYRVNCTAHSSGTAVVMLKRGDDSVAG